MKEFMEETAMEYIEETVKYLRMNLWKKLGVEYEETGKKFGMESNNSQFLS